MQLELDDIDSRIKANKLKQVTSARLMDSPGVPDSEGLLSFEIFGLPGTSKRRETFAYIDLGDTMLAPAIYKAIQKKHPLINDIINGQINVILDDKGNIVKDTDPESQNTGLAWLIANIRKINFVKNDSLQRNVELDMVQRATDSQIFIRRWIVIPAALRDFSEQVSTEGRKVAVHELNEMYQKILNLSSALERFDGRPDIGNGTRIRMMSMLVELYEYFLDVLGRKTGFIQANVLKKTVDYGSSSVIVPMPMSAQRPEDMIIKFGEQGVPINQIVAIFKPFFNAAFRNFLSDEVRNIRQTEVALDIEYDLIDDAEQRVQDTEYIDGLLKRFMDSPENRFEPIIPPQNNKKQIPFKININNEWVDMLMMDAMFIIATEIVRTHNLVFSRYPIENYQSVAIAKIVILTTHKTREVNIRGRTFKSYPDFRKYPDPTKQLISASMVNTSYCPAMNADFDGDMMYLRGLYTDESNMDAERLRTSKSMILDPKGASSRTLAGEGLATLYALTRRKPIVVKDK